MKFEGGTTQSKLTFPNFNRYRFNVKLTLPKEALKLRLLFYYLLLFKFA